MIGEKDGLVCLGDWFFYCESAKLVFLPLSRKVGLLTAKAQSLNGKTQGDDLVGMDGNGTRITRKKGWTRILGVNIFELVKDEMGGMN